MQARLSGAVVALVLESRLPQKRLLSGTSRVVSVNPYWQTGF
ncbi:hypothetical protein [Coleofasciculus sp. G2-EDA-02]